MGVQCDSGLCLWSWLPLCNGVVDCPDLSDEVNCGKRIFTKKIIVFIFFIANGVIKKKRFVQLQIPRSSVTTGCGSPQISGVMGLTIVMTTVMRGIAVSYHSDI